MLCVGSDKTVLDFKFPARVKCQFGFSHMLISVLHLHLFWPLEARESSVCLCTSGWLSLLSRVKWPQRPSYWSMEPLAGMEHECRIGMEWRLNKSKNEFFICIGKVRKWRLRTLRHLQTAAHPKPLNSDSNVSGTMPRLPLVRVYLKVCAKKNLSSHSSLPVCATSAETIRDKSITKLILENHVAQRAHIF